MFKNTYILLFTLSLLFIISQPQALAHIGSAGIVHEGKAGNYQLQVFVEPPDVIPGTAKVTVLTDGTDIRYIGAKPIFYWSGDEGSPRSDELLPTPGESGRFEGSIWLMSSGSASVQINIEGDRGKGQLLIPVMAFSTAQRTMPASTGWLLAGLALLLVGLLTTIIGASTGDSLLAPGIAEDVKIKQKRVVGSVIGAVICMGLLYIGNWWWNDWANDYKENNLYRPPVAHSKVSLKNGVATLHLRVDSNSVRDRSFSYVVPDHGKLMHLFLVKQGTMNAFAHLHPVRKDSLNFEANLPDLPAGKYLLYADVMRYHGLQYTLADTVEVPAIQPNTSLDPDDTYVLTNALNETPTLANTNITICGTPGVKIPLQDGSSIVWEKTPNDRIVPRKVLNLKFSVLDPSGKPAQLQPYLGMMGHAAILKDDGTVYIHLHPNGTFSNTAVSILQKRIDETSKEVKLATPKAFKDSIDKIMVNIKDMSETERDKFLMPNMNHKTDKHHEGEVVFPYSFPREGNYRIWLQIKRNGRILTGSFDAKVI